MNRVLFNYDGHCIINKNGRMLNASIKPSFSFDYVFISVTEDSNDGSKNGLIKTADGSVISQMTSSQIVEVLSYIDKLVIDDNKVKASNNMQQSLLYLSNTDYIDNKYIRDVIRDKTITEAEFNEKYFDILSNRKKAIYIISEAQKLLN